MRLCRNSLPASVWRLPTASGISYAILAMVTIMPVIMPLFVAVIIVSLIANDRPTIIVIAVVSISVMITASGQSQKHSQNQ